MNPENTEKLLKTHGVKPTAQRVVIMEYLLNTECHPTADQVYCNVSRELPVAISKATVYNTLKLLQDKGVIKAIGTEPGCTRYDAKLISHHHFVDLDTGKIFDIDEQFLGSVNVDLDKKYQVHDYQVTFYGHVKEDETV